MKKRKCLTFLFCLILCYSLFQHTAVAQNSSEASILSQGSITYPSSNVNLAVIPNDWGVYDNAPSSFTANIHVDSSVTYNGYVSIRSDPHTSADTNTYREIDGTWYNVNPGDHIEVTVWIKTSASGLNPDPSSYAGGSIGIDFYAHTSAGYGIAYVGSTSWVDALGEPNYYGQPLGSNDQIIGSHWWVPWGSGWTEIGWNCYVPTATVTYVYTNGPTACTPTHVDSFVCWLGSGSPNNPGQIWFADAVLHINPT